MKVLIWGTGEYGTSVYNKMIYEKNIQIIGFVETKKESDMFKGLRIFSPEELLCTEYDLCIVANTHMDSVKKTCDYYGINSDKNVYMCIDIDSMLNLKAINGIIPDFWMKYGAIKGGSAFTNSCSFMPHHDLPVYLISADEFIYGTGFFAMLLGVIEYLSYCKIVGGSPIVLLSKDFLYYESDGFLETNNPYDYYYFQKKWNWDLMKKLNVIKSQSHHKDYFYRCIGTDYIPRYNLMCNETLAEKYIDKAAELYKEYIVFNNETKKYIEEKLLNTIDNKRTLGVHVRGGGYLQYAPGHPIPVTIEEVFCTVDEVIDKYDQVFVASDDQSYIKRFVERYGEKTVYLDAFRRDSNDDVLLDSIFKCSKRANHNYLLGIEALCDAEALANCDGLVCGITNVSVYSRIRKKSMGKDYSYLNIINKGICPADKTKLSEMVKNEKRMLEEKNRQR